MLKSESQLHVIFDSDFNIFLNGVYSSTTLRQVEFRAVFAGLATVS